MTINISRRKLIGTTTAGIAAASLAGSPAAFAQDDKPSVSIGSKDITEQLIISEMVAQLLENEGFPVERNLNLGGTFIVHEAMMNGDIDTYLEYTGTALIAVLGLGLPEREESGTAEASATPASGDGYAQQVFDIVEERYAEEFDLEWLEPWGFNNTTALAMSRERAEELGIVTISDLQEHAGDLNIGAAAEVVVREDGVPGVQETYGFEFGDVTTLDAGLMYSAVDAGDVDVIMAYATDGRIGTLDLVLLEDDLGFFPPYFAAPVFRKDTLEESPEIRDIVNQLAGRVPDERMTEMNALADDEGVPHADIVRNFLIEEGIVEED